jgi:deoxyribodipyrimidine photo-lyase
MMSPAHPAIAMGNTHIFIWDDDHIASLNYSPGRLAFQRSALFCPDLHSQGRSVAAVLLDLASEGRFQTIVTGDTPDPCLLRTIAQLQPSIHVQTVPHPPFADLTGQLDLARFSRYWSKAQHAFSA